MGLAAARGDWAAAYRLFEDTESSLTGYPPRIGTKFAIMAAEAALSVGDVDTAAGRLALLETAPATESQLDFITFLRGHLLKQQGKTDKAMELWKSVAAVGDARR